MKAQTETVALKPDRTGFAVGMIVFGTSLIACSDATSINQTRASEAKPTMGNNRLEPNRIKLIQGSVPPIRLARLKAYQNTTGCLLHDNH